MTEWKYGDSWEKFPIEEGEIWQSGDSKIAVADIRNPLPVFMQEADMVYCDPPWSKGNANSFITKAGQDGYVADFKDFMDVLFERIAWVSPNVCYLEIGKQHVADFEERFGNIFPVIQVWPITYYKKKPCFLIRGGQTATDTDYSGIDEELTPSLAIQAENPRCIADLCTGRGLTLLSAHANGKQFVGTELNKRRLAVAIEKAAKMGVSYEKNIL